VARCAAIAAKGEPCKGLVKAGNEYCPAHDPERVEARRISASKAGRSKPASEIAEVKCQLRKLAEDCRAGRVNTGVASVTSQVLGIWLKAADTEIREREATVKEREFVEIGKPEFETLQSEVQEVRQMLDEREAREKRGTAWAG
jgi:hypothetical protein